MFRTFVTSEKDDFAKFLADGATRCVRYFAGNFTKSFFSHVTKFRNAGLLIVRSQTDKIFFG